MSLRDINFDRVRNRNERRVIRVMEKLLAEPQRQSTAQLLSIKDLQDIYALALNHLPARYAQPGTIVVGDPVRDEDAREAVMDATDTVISRPKD